MAFLTLYRKKLEENFSFLDKLFADRGIHWGVVSKILCGNVLYLKELLSLGVTEIHDSRISNLRKVKSLAPDVQTVYIKPPAKRSIPGIVTHADVSFNTELATIRMLSDEAVRQKKQHKVIIMIEMGDLREGVMGDELVDFYRQVLRMPNITISGIGTNLNCLNGVMPTQDKLIQLSLYKQLVEAKLGISIPWVSGGTSVAIPLILRNVRPMAVNHFRIGEALFFGKDLFTGQTIDGMNDEVFRLRAEIIEINEKPAIPSGELGPNVTGSVQDIPDASDLGATSLRAILDIGLLDMQPQYLIPDDSGVDLIDASSDMLVADISKSAKSYSVGDIISFKLQYMGALYLLNSAYIEKRIADGNQ